MFSTLIGKKKMTETALAKLLVEGTLKTAEPIFKEVVDYINECPHFDRNPEVTEQDDIDFLLTVFTCNISRIPNYLKGGQEKRVAHAIIKQLSFHLYMDMRDLSTRIQDCKSLMKRLNHPSKNLIYAMPKAVFSLYGLNEFQQPYFRDLNSPNPLYLKEMNQMMEVMVWDWDFLVEEYRFTP
ncbi:MAG: hypothetical protein HKN79_05255 [Flavobacteriales bacterium]|nr:hypothetical protein [Flavobacteriales bacterium]